MILDERSLGYWRLAEPPRTQRTPRQPRSRYEKVFISLLRVLCVLCGESALGIIPMLVKICGITRAEDAQAAVDAGAQALGFVFWPDSPRFIEPARARA